MILVSFSPLWLLVPVTPLLFIWLQWCSHRSCWWPILAVVPGLVLALWPQPVLFAPQFWPSASWGVADTLGRSWLAFTSVLWGVAGWYAGAAQRDKADEMRFWLFWLLALSGNMLLVIAQDGVSFYVGFTVMSLAAYGLVVHSGRPEARRAGLLYLQLAILGEMLLLAGLVMRAHAAGIADGNPLALDLSYWGGVPIDGVTAGMILVGLGIKAGFWPLHIWLPHAHPVAPAAASAVLSGAMIKAGILGLWRFFPEADPLVHEWAPLLALIAVMGALLAALQGFFAQRPKEVLAWSSVSQMGYLLLIMAVAWSWPEWHVAVGTVLLIYACHHAFAKGALFLSAGVASSYRLGMTHLSLMAVAALALAGGPLTSGALGKALIKDLSYLSDWEWLTPLLALGSVLTALLVLRFVLMVVDEQARAGASRPSPPTSLWAPIAFLTWGALLAPWGWPAWRAGMLTLLASGALWAAVWPVLVAVMVYGLFRLSARLRWVKVPSRERAGARFSIWLALGVRYWLLATWMRRPRFSCSLAGWRRWERYGNRHWSGGSIVPITASLVMGLLLLGWWW